MMATGSLENIRGRPQIGCSIKPAVMVIFQLVADAIQKNCFQSY